MLWALHSMQNMTDSSHRPLCETPKWLRYLFFLPFLFCVRAKNSSSHTPLWKLRSMIIFFSFLGVFLVLESFPLRTAPYRQFSYPIPFCLTDNQCSRPGSWMTIGQVILVVLNVPWLRHGNNLCHCDWSIWEISWGKKNIMCSEPGVFF